MKAKSLLISSLLSIVVYTSIGGHAYAKPEAAADVPMVKLYDHPKANKPIQQVSPATALIPIFKQDGWVKVGNPNTGDVSWVNAEQWQQATRAFHTPDIQSVYVYTQQAAPGKKPTVNIVAYRNGEKLTDLQAKQLYEQAKKQQQVQQQALLAFQHSMQQWFDQPTLLHDIFWQREWQELMRPLPVGLTSPFDLPTQTQQQKS